MVRPANATTLRAYTPVLDSGGPHTVLVNSLDSADTDNLAASLSVLPTDYKSKVFDARRVFPPWYRCGPRGMRLLPPL